MPSFPGVTKHSDLRLLCPELTGAALKWTSAAEPRNENVRQTNRPASGSKAYLPPTEYKVGQEAVGLCGGSQCRRIRFIDAGRRSEVVYTPANIQLARPSNVSLDLNNDGIRDFFFSLRQFKGSFLNIQPTKLNPQDAVWGTGTSASVLDSGVTLGAQGQFQPGHKFMVAINCSSGMCSSHGPWLNARTSTWALHLLFAAQFTSAGQDSPLSPIKGCGQR
jgi:hypothetical protein